MTKLVRVEHEFVNREGFIFRTPYAFFDDVASEDISPVEFTHLCGSIAERLERVARLYRDVEQQQKRYNT